MVIDNKQPLISVITPVYNGKETIRKAIESVLCQTYNNIQYIIVDGGSTDGTLDVIKEYQGSIDYWVSEPDAGISDAFNKGIKKARGELIGIINADDWYEKDAVAAVVREMTRGDVFYGLTEFWGDHGSDGVWEPDHLLLEKEMTLNHSAVFVAKSVYEQFGTFSDKYKYAMDYDLLLRLRVSGAKFVKVNKKLTNMQLQGVSDRNWRRAYQEVRSIKQKYLGTSVRHDIYYYKQLIRRVVREGMINAGMEGLVGAYRRNISIMKKH